MGGREREITVVKVSDYPANSLDLAVGDFRSFLHLTFNTYPANVENMVSS
jgi:hypothetical protein